MLTNKDCPEIPCFLCNILQKIPQWLELNTPYERFEVIEGKVYLHTQSGSFLCGNNIVRALCYLSQNKDIVISRDELETHIWQGITVGPSSLPVLIHELRRVLQVTSYELVTVRNKGFILRKKPQRIHYGSS
ncbi:winged helix-turn-helix domain-containing protein [Vibrio sp. SCSIO 43135]|uniref:winged helix-turn-helix domain-containing protein n=1 Tax=Vibrio sp. SCSIO 43135 TaxID=2819096 RepID=UPI0020756D80|nr:winged helix-turn-helix domain-containing protein [Vibrio sp. SCSIO 43135]USD43185.1 winged helix-turn-helix domain-containing protein [Vibrio sp. SCSIO 43135]